MTDYFGSTSDPERGWALAALTGALTFRHAKPGMIRALIAERTAPVLFELSYDYVGDLSETVALMWPVTGDRISDHEDLKLSAVITSLSSLAKAALPGQLARWLDPLGGTRRCELLQMSSVVLRNRVSARPVRYAALVLSANWPEAGQLL